MKKTLYIIGGNAGEQLIRNYMSEKYHSIIYVDALSKTTLLDSIQPIIAEFGAGVHSCDWISGVGDNVLRENIFQLLTPHRLPVNCIHRTAIIDHTAVIGYGVLISPGAIINQYAAIGNGCIINTGSIIEHDCIINHWAQIGPGVSMGGNVLVGSRASVWTGASIIPKIKIGFDAVVGAGATVISDVMPHTTVVGTPAIEIDNTTL